MKILAISGSARQRSTNTALLRAIASQAPAGIEISVFDGIGRLPVFSPDLESRPLPGSVRAFINAIATCDGLIVASPEYVRSIPGGLKNAIDWLVSGEELVGKPVALVHASHRGDDMLQALRVVLGTVTERFAPDIFLRFALMKKEPQEIGDFIAEPENRARVAAFLETFAAHCAAPIEAGGAA